jgi:pimeloyl-ACP methyl ester carboxylesterase
VRALAIVALALAAGALYGVVHDQVTARVSLEYFTVAHPPIGTDSPTRLALYWGAVATSGPALALGALLAAAARFGGRPRVDARDLVAPIARLLAAMAVGAFAAGVLAFAAARLLDLAPPAALAPDVPPEAHARLLAAAGAHLASYAVGLGGGLALCARTWQRRAGFRLRPRPLRERVGRALSAAAVVAGLALVLGPLGIAWHLSGRIMRAPWYQPGQPDRELPASRFTDPLVDFGLAFESVEFPAADGARLRGWWVPAAPDARAAVVAAHGGWGDRRSLLPLAPELRAAGLPVLLFDFREHGVSDGRGRGTSLGLRESEDVSSAVAFLGARGFERIGVLGYSLGASSAILAAARDPAIDAVVSVCSGTTLLHALENRPETGRGPEWMRRLVARVFLWRVGAPFETVRSLDAGPLHAVERIAPRPLLLVTGGDDPNIPVAQARQLHARAGASARLLIVPGANHLDVFDVDAERTRAAIVAFLSRALAPGAP